jgi:hypothetical protein
MCRFIALCLATLVRLSFAETLQGHKSRPVTMLQARPHAIHFKPILDVGEGQATDIQFLPTKIAFGIEA